MAKTAHLVKVIVTTVWAEVDSDTGDATIQVGAQSECSAADWPTFYERWKADWDKVSDALKAQEPPPEPIEG